MEQQWIEDFRKRFADRKVTPPDGLWNSVEAAMNSGAGRDVGAAGKRRRAVLVPVWCRRAVAVAACVAALAVMVWYFSDRPSVPYAAVGGGPDVGAPAGRLEEAASVAAGGGMLPRAVAGVVRAVADEHGVGGGTLAAAVPPVDSMAVENGAVAIGENEADEGHEADAESVVVRRGHIRDASPEDGSAGLLASAGRSVERGGGVSVALYGTGLTSFGASTGNTGASLRPYRMQQDAMAAYDVMLLSASVGGVEAGEVRVKHRHPVKFGASVRFNLAGRFGLETGLNYSYHSSDIASGDEDGGYTTEQKLHFVGIPVAVSYEIWHTDFLEVYASAGGAVELCVSGKSHTEYVEGGKVVSTDGADVRDKRPQWSVGASAGVQYNINNVVGVYLEPGVNYYLDNGSSVNTVYKDKPLNFNLNVGLRFTIR